MSIKIVNMGTPNYAKIILDKILNDGSFSVDLVLTQPDKPVGSQRF